MNNQYLNSGDILAERYVIGKELGRGGISVVYEAFDQKLKLNIALKLLVPPPASAKFIQERTRREVSFVRELDHPNIAKVFDFDHSDGKHFILMKKISGKDLKKLVEEKGLLKSDEIKKIALQISDALSFAHSKGVLHRDVKPSNILIDEQGNAILSDFGSAKMEGQQTITSSGAFVGTINYLPPEVFSGSKPDARADIYSLGLTLYYAATGELPPINKATMLVEAEQRGHFPSANIEKQLITAIAMCTSSLPGDRFQTAAQTKKFLERQQTFAAIPAEKNFPELRTHCLICDVADPFGNPICADCMPETRNAENLQSIMIEKPKGKKNQKLLAEKLSSLLALKKRSSDIELVSIGSKPLAQVPLAFAPKVIQKLSKLGIGANVIPKSKLWSTLPLGFNILLIEIMLLNLYMANKINPWFAFLGLAVPGTLGFLALRISNKPLLNSIPSLGILPEKTEANVLNTLAELSSKSTKTLLKDIVKTIQELNLNNNSSHISKLVERSCEVAKSLNNYENIVSRLEQQNVKASSSAIESSLLKAEKTKNI